MGFYKRKKFENGAEIALYEIAEEEDELRRICEPIPMKEVEELQLIKSSSRRKEKLAVRALLNEMFPERVSLEHLADGKPYLQNCTVKISISHCNRFAAVITHPEEEVGIDIESLERNFSAVKKKVLSDRELAELSDDNLNTQLAIYWSAKEAIYKRISQNDIDFAKQIIIDKFIPKKRGELGATVIHKNGNEEKLILNYEIFDNHIMAWSVGWKETV